MRWSALGIHIGPFASFAARTGNQLLKWSSRAALDCPDSRTAEKSNSCPFHLAQECSKCASEKESKWDHREAKRGEIVATSVFTPLQGHWPSVRCDRKQRRKYYEWRTKQKMESESDGARRRDRDGRTRTFVFEELAIGMVSHVFLLRSWISKSSVALRANKSR